MKELRLSGQRNRGDQVCFIYIMSYEDRQAYSNLVLDNLDIISLCTRYPRKEQLPKPKPNNQMISQVSVSRDGETLRPRCSFSPSIARSIP